MVGMIIMIPRNFVVIVIYQIIQGVPDIGNEWVDRVLILRIERYSYFV
jgi:hypothetical protein